MRSNAGRLIFAAAALALGALACNYPGITAPTPFPFTTPNLTLTAVYGAVAATATPGNGQLPASPSAPTPTLTATAPALASPTVGIFPATATLAPPTATQPPTQEPLPTAISYAGPGMRAGRSMTAYYLSQAITIDGEFDDWNLERYTVADPVAGAANWTGEGDLSARVMWGWDEDYLYLAARVRDDIYVQEAVEEELFKGDSLEILMDTELSPDFYLDELSRDDYQLGLSAGEEPGQDPEAYLWFPREEEGGVSGVEIDATEVDDGYRVEAAIPWEVFNLSPRGGDHFGFAFSVSDNDDQNADIQETMVSNIAARDLIDPTTWGDLTLSDESPSPVNPLARRSPQVEAVFFANAPAIDGNLGEWTVEDAELSSVVYGKDQWNGQADLAGTMMAGWDASNLYLAAVVIDDRYVQHSTGADIFLGDSLEILFDGDVQADFYDRNLSGDDYQLGISAGRPTADLNTEAYLWFPQARAGGRNGVLISTTAVGGSYQVEAAIPWSVFGTTPEQGQHYGFAFSVSDNDDPDRAVQQTMISNVSSRDLTDPTTWGDLLLSRY